MLLNQKNCTCQHSKLIAKFYLNVKCNGCMLSDNHDLYVLDFINTVNARAKPTGRIFTIVGNACPLTRITTTTEVPLRKSSALDNKTPKPVVTLVYSRKPRKSKTSVPVNNYKVIKSVTANNSEPSQSWGSIVSNVPSSSLDECSTALWDMMASSPICLLSKASKTKSWLWHRRLSHLNFGAINHLARHGLVRGLPKLKFEKDHLCPACVLGKSTKKPHKLKSENTNQEKLYLLHMDLCGPMCVVSVNGKKYILVIVDDYSRFTRTLREHYEKVGISHETSVTRSPQQNGVVERRNRTLIEAAHTMLIYAKAPLFLWAKVVATACYTKNRSMILRRHGKTPYEILHNKPPDLSYLHVFGALCYPTNDSENLSKLQSKADIVVASEVSAPVLVDSTGSPLSTIVDQDAPSPSNSQTTPETEPPIISNDVEEDNYDIEVAHMGNDPYFGVSILEIPFDQSSSPGSIHTIVHPDRQISEHNSKWTKDHLLENIIGELSRPVSTRLQLHEQALFCYYDAFLTVVESFTDGV
ncbi:retrovirus-related pol polyprotein from transposon TNT 1-94 [Tanacetum coccineum]